MKKDNPPLENEYFFHGSNKAARTQPDEIGLFLRRAQTDSDILTLESDKDGDQGSSLPQFQLIR